MGWQGYDNEGCMPGDRDRIARVSELTQRLKHKPDAVIAERSRLEREVIARAREFTDDTEPRENWDALVAYRELCRAVDALNNFESSQQQIKK